MSDDSSIENTLPRLLADVASSKGNDTSALSSIYDLCNEENQHNRIPMVCTSKWDVLDPIIRCLSHEEGNGKQLACLILANLAIPFENKAIMALGIFSEDLFTGLFSIVQSGVPEAYLACICLVNISYLRDSVEPIFFFSLEAPNDMDNDVRRIESPNSACRILESVIGSCVYPPIVASVRSEAVRWACALVKQVTIKKGVCDALIQTKIPLRVLGYLKHTKQPLCKWTENSVEDLSLGILLNLSKWTKALKHLKDLDTFDTIGYIVGRGGVHDYKASLVRACIETL